MSSPFGSEAIAEVVLAKAPLARVLTQVRFPRLTRLVTGDDAANAFASALADAYPEFNQAQQMTITLSPDGVSQTPVAGGQVWNLISADKAWQVSFGAEFLAVHTSAYTTRAEFVARCRPVLDAFAGHVAVPSCERIGVRYINAVDLSTVPLDDLQSLVRPEMRGGLAVPREGTALVTAMNEALYDLSPSAAAVGGQPVAVSDGLQARWGLLPPGAQLDMTLPPFARAAWVLDLDAFRAAPAQFTSEEIGTQMSELAERAYRYFRWVVTDDFLTRFGGGQ